MRKIKVNPSNDRSTKGTPSQVSASSDGSATTLDRSQGRVNTVLGTMTQASRQVVRVTLPIWLRVILLLFEFLQLLSIAISLPLIRRPGDENIDTSSPFYLRIFTQFLRAFHDPVGSLGEMELVATISMVMPTLCVLIFGIFELSRLKRGALPSWKISLILALGFALQRSLYLPLGNLLTARLTCWGDGNNAVYGGPCFSGSGLFWFIASALVHIVASISAAYDSLFHHNFLPTTSPSWKGFLPSFSVSHGRIHFLFFLFKLAFLATSGGLYLFPSLKNLILLGFAVLSLLGFTYWSSFYSRTLGGIHAALMGACVWALFLCSANNIWELERVLGVGSTFLLVSSLVGGFMAALVCFGFYWGRTSYFRKALNSNSLADCRNFKYPFEVDMSLKRAFCNKWADNSSVIEAADTLLQNAARTFPNSPFVALSNGMFGMLVKHQPQSMILQARNAMRVSPFIDIAFVIEIALDNARRMSVIDHETNQEMAADLEHQLKSAQNHKQAALRAASSFWQLIMRSHENMNPSTLMKIASTLDSHDKQARQLFRQLVLRYPSSPVVLRRYATYLQQLQNDEDAANNLYALAEDYEKKQQRHSHFEETQSSEDEPQPHGSEVKRARFQSEPIVKLMEPGELELSCPESFASAGENTSSDDESVKSSASTMRSYEIAQMQALQKRIDMSGRNSSNRVQIGILLALLILCGISSFIFIVSLLNLDSYNKNMQLMNFTVGSGWAADTALFEVRTMELEMLAHVDHSQSQETALQEIRNFELSFDEMFKNSGISPEVQDFWTSHHMPLAVYLPGVNSSNFWNGTYSYEERPLWDSGYSYMNSIRDIIWSLELNPDLVHTLRSTPDFRMVLDNGPNTFISYLQSLGILYSKTVEKVCNNLVYITLISLPSSLLIVVACVIGFRIVLNFLKEDRRAAIKLLMDLPKSAVINVTERLQIDEHSGSDASSRASFDALKILFLFFLLTCVITFGLCSLMGGFTLQFGLGSSFHGEEMNMIGTRATHAVALLLYAQELTIDDFTSFTTPGLLDIMMSEFESLNQVDQKLKYGNQGGVSYIQVDAQLYDLWYERVCPPELNLTACYGIGVLFRRYLDAINVFYQVPHEEQTRFHPSFELAYRIHGQVLAWLKEDKTYLEEMFFNSNLRIKNILMITFWCILPFLLLAYVVLKLFLSRAHSEINRVYKMLLFIPHNVLNSVGSVKEYLDGGQVNLEDAEKESARKTIMEACEDAVIVTDTKLKIQIFNSAAERTLGYTLDQALGSDLSMIFPKGSRTTKDMLKKLKSNHTELRQWDTVAMRSDGNLIPVWLSVTKSTLVMGKPTVALFIRDMTEAKERERVIEQEKKRAMGLLLNILPRSIAQLLQQPKENKVIATEYQSATTLFADIVNFTPKSAEMEPESLVMMLHTLFSEWDMLCQVHRVEKIKTIGDCYMVCSGIPDHFEDHADAMMKFAATMMEILAKFNQKKDHQWPELEIRVGINSGRLIAGVLGAHKFAYDVWGDSVNVASRMESSGLPGYVQISQATHSLLSENALSCYSFECREEVEVKGKGKMKCFLWQPPKYSDLENSNPLVSAPSFEKISQLASGIHDYEPIPRRLLATPKRQIRTPDHSLPATPSHSDDNDIALNVLSGVSE